MKNTILILALIPTLTFASITSNLKFGMANTQVIELQSFLISKGYLQANYKTGYFGSKTLGAVKNYQLDSELPSTGFVGPLTRMSIEEDTTKITVTTTEATSTATTTEKATTTEPFITPIATPTATEYNKLYMEETAQVNLNVTFGTPYAVLLKENIYRGYIPVEITGDVLSNGGIVLIDGTIPDPTGTGLNGIGREFNKNSKAPYNIPLEQVRGLYTYKITAKNSNGEIIQETTGTLDIPKFSQE